MPVEIQNLLWETWQRDQGVWSAFCEGQGIGPKVPPLAAYSFVQRQIGDYAFDPNVEKDVVVQMIHQAQEFLEAAQRYLREE